MINTLILDRLIQMIRIGKSIQLKFVKYRNYVTLCTEWMIYTIIFPAKIFWCYGNKYDINTCLCFGNYSFCPLTSMIGFLVNLPYDIYSNKKETSDFRGTVSIDPVEMSQQK